ncbi:dienelactone hydrolase family protein [Noviluteimonas gilva]|uniref:Dienelactone hydrolase family protein n=1 Tax=Noviluteimonas gilva TaxID=2682097 RepID=A0A7C9HUG1_9GAMM|nr:dienelactone hydrolase family protein [Lysobacter gilvus]MUV15071.1 dienelactone hydrolase family protein [Lysobacter gilvus]
MHGWIDIETPHGPVRGWRAEPPGPSKGAVVVIQEIFGVNAHIRSVAERLADAGFVALAPALFDPVEHGVELGYDDAGVQRARALVSALGTERAMDVINASAEKLQMEGLRVGAIGFCWGGTLAFLCATRLSLPAVGYYGARSVPFLDEKAGAPLMFHFGADDNSIPPHDIELHRQKQPQAQVFVYEGTGHAFNRDVDPKAYGADAAKLAWQRTLDFLEAQLR